MFSKVIRKSLLISRFYEKNICKIEKPLQTYQRFLIVEKRFIYTRSTLAYSQHPKKKFQESQEENSDKGDSENSKFIPKQQSQEKNLEKDNENLENNIGIESRTEKKEDSLVEQIRKAREEQYRQEKKHRYYGRNMILHSFANVKDRRKETYLECLRMYKNAVGRKMDRVLFVYAALKYMEEFNVHKDLSVYKELLDIFPKEKMVPTNIFQTFFMHYPKEQYCVVALLEQMEDNAVIPDSEMELTLLNIFGSHGLPLQKYWKMMYWMPKFKNLNPWPVPHPIPNDPFELAKLAMTKISSVDVESTLSIFDTNDIEDSLDKTWIVSAMAPKQKELLKNHNKTSAIYVEGPFKIYVATKAVDYFTLRADVLPTRKWPEYDTDAVDKIRNPYLESFRSDVIVRPSVHEEVDATIFANCATGTSTKDTLLSWIRCLQKENPVLGEIPVVFKLQNYTRENYYLEKADKEKQDPAHDEDIIKEESNPKILHK